MMAICSEDSEEDRFFDAREDISSVSDSGSDCAEGLDSNTRCLDSISGISRYEVWIGRPDSVHERRDKFFRWMGLGSGSCSALDQSRRGDSDCIDPLGMISADVDRITETSGAVLRSSVFSGDGSSSRRSSISSWSGYAPNSSEDGASEGNFMCRIRNLDDGSEFIVDELGQDGTLSRLREVRSNRLYTVDEFQRMLGLSPFVQQFMRRDVGAAGGAASNLGVTLKRRKKGWLRRLGSVACVVDRQGLESKSEYVDLHQNTRAWTRRVKVRQCKKRCKEFSALYMGQEFQAHEGPILTMKFSPDGQYLASAGEDGIVRVWQVMECERDEADIPVDDPSCIYFKMNGSCNLAPLFVDKAKMGKNRSMKKTSDSACIILPPKVFRISEKPLHEFHGHSGEVLDLSWSKNKYLLSSSVDKTVRLWQVGCDECLKVFSHNNYVTCVQFNPIDDKYFISGSIDGKVRIWAIPDCHVVDWTDIREIVTAVCYRPDGQGGIVGSMIGNCRFYDAFDNHLQLDAQLCFQGKKKSPGKRITGFQFSPNDPRKLMVTSADSLIRILDGLDVIWKYRGLRNAASQISASFTSDGKHIVSASEDSNVYVWNYNAASGRTSQQSKSIWSCERFFSSSVSVAIPWSGMQSGSSVSPTSEGVASSQQACQDSTRVSGNGCQCSSDLLHGTFSLLSSGHFSLGHGFFSEILPKGSATWPEEKLPALRSVSMSSVMCKSQYKFLKMSCQNTVTSPHAWGSVIVTAGWDGRIRSFHNYGLPVRL